MSELPQVTIDRDLCIGSGTCEAMNPAVFQLGEDGIAFVVEGAKADSQSLLDAVNSCPSGAIQLTAAVEEVS